MLAQTGIHAILAAALYFSFVHNSHAQVNPYARVTDPRAISYLNGDDSSQLVNMGYLSDNVITDPVDSSYVIVAGTGPGILTHFWTTTNNGHIDTLSTLRLWVDDSLVLTSQTGNFFAHAHGLMRGPLDTALSGGFLSDVQIPFKKNFRITHKGPFLAWKAAWRPVPDSAAISSFAYPSSTLILQQTAAESVCRMQTSPWTGESSTSIDGSQSLGSGDTMILADLTGFGWIKTVHIDPILSLEALQGVSLQIFWDHSPIPSVDVPLGDFFGCGAGVKSIMSLPIRSDSVTGFTSYFPMPFIEHALLRLVSHASIAIHIGVHIEYGREPVDPAKDAYFGAQFAESKVTREQVFHHVADVCGQGKFVGVFLMLPDSIKPNFMEGDPTLLIDSDLSEGTTFDGVRFSHSITYAGTEDYFDGGWYFIDGPAQLAFGGCPQTWSCLYRFHFLDAVTFKTSFHFLWEHGNGNDYRCHVRSIGFYYVRHLPFWVSADTVVYGQHWQVGGSGYQANEPLEIRLGTRTIYQGTTDSQGEFRFSTVVPPDWNVGAFMLAVNGTSSAIPITIRSAPFLSFVVDSGNQIFAWRDSVDLYGFGFRPGERLTLSLDTVQASTAGPALSDSVGNVHVRMYIPWIEAGAYRIRSVGDSGSNATSDTSLVVSRTLRYEFEDIMPPAYADGGPFADYVGWNETSHWGNQSFVFMYNTSVGSRLAFNFAVPYADTFAVTIYGTTGPRYGDYTVLLDGVESGLFHCFRSATQFNDFRRSDPFQAGVHYLGKGNHVIEFDCEKDYYGNGEADLAADDFFLTPMSEFHPLRIPVLSPNSITAFTIFPNPAPIGSSVNIGDIPEDLAAANTQVTVDLIDLLGRRVQRLQVRPTDRVLAAPIGKVQPGYYLLRLSNSRIGVVGLPFVVGP